VPGLFHVEAQAGKRPVSPFVVEALGAKQDRECKKDSALEKS
jgi:hypothetical protein